jgi:hypothetical protein
LGLALAGCVTTDGSIAGLGDLIQIKTVSGRSSDNEGIVSETLAADRNLRRRMFNVSAEEEQIAQKVLESPEYLFNSLSIEAKRIDPNRCLSTEYDSARGFHADCKTVWRNATLGDMRMWRTSDEYRTTDGRLCRAYKISYLQQHVIGARWKNIGGTACRGPDGIWRKV